MKSISIHQFAKEKLQQRWQNFYKHQNAFNHPKSFHKLQAENLQMRLAENPKHDDPKWERVSYLYKFNEFQF